MMGGIETLNYNLISYLRKNTKFSQYITDKFAYLILTSSNDVEVFNKFSVIKILWLHYKLQIEKAIRKKQLIQFKNNITVFV